MLSAHAQDAIDYDGWKLEWAEEFNTPLDTIGLSERWRFFYPWGRVLASPIEAGYYTAQELHVANGVLSLTSTRRPQQQTYNGKPLDYNTGMLFSRHPTDSLRPYNCNPAEGFSYGLFEVRARQPEHPGSAPAFWLFGGVPDEIDVFEAAPDAFTSNFHLAPGGYWRPSRQRELACQCLFYNTDPAGNLHEQFHTYGVSWLPNGVVFYYDGVPIRHETRLIPAGCAMSVIVNIAALQNSHHSSDTLAIDYIRVYRPRHLPTVPPMLRPGGDFPQTEQAWLPAETQPGRPDQGTHQTWRLAPWPRHPAQPRLQLADNYNPPCDLTMPLPIAGHWAPAWQQTYGTPELRVLIAAPDSVQWRVHNALGQPVGSGTAAGGTWWRPDWPELPPGSYSLHLRQNTTTVVQPLFIIGRPVGSAPDTGWLPAALPTTGPQ